MIPTRNMAAQGRLWSSTKQKGSQGEPDDPRHIANYLRGVLRDAINRGADLGQELFETRLEERHLLVANADFVVIEGQHKEIGRRGPKRRLRCINCDEPRYFCDC